jgi:hypothetical protein
MLDVWPALPLLIRDRAYLTESFDNIISVLERSDRVARVGQIYLYIPAWELEEVSAAMQEPFPELTSLELTSYVPVTVLPDSFLGGSAPRIRFLLLNHIPFPGLPKLLLSATHLVRLTLWNIPHSGYFSPEAMVTALSVLTSLEELFLEFASPRSRPDQASRRPPPLIRSALPVLTSLNFKGVSEYLEDFVARVDAPQLNKIYIFFFNDIVFDTPQFIQFVSRTPTLRALEKARVAFRHTNAEVNLSSQTSEYGKLELRVQISCRELDWQLSSLEQICSTSRLPPFSTLEDLYIYEDRFWQDNIENTLWLELLHPFTSVKNLYLCKKSAPRIIPAMQELVGGRTTEVLPNLKNISLEELESSGPVQEGIGLFVAARQVTNHPIAVSRWDNSVRDKF